MFYEVTLDRGLGVGLGMAQFLRRIDWPPEVDAVLGQASDIDLAQALGLDRKTVGLRRRLLNIPPYRGPRTFHTLICESCGQPFQTRGRSSRLRRTCPPPLRSRHLSACHRKLLRKLAENRQPTSLLHKTPGMRFIR